MVQSARCEEWDVVVAVQVWLGNYRAAGVVSRPDGKQYIAILSGVGGWSGAIVAGGLDPRDATGALGFVGAMGDLPDYTTRGGMLYVFALP